MPVVNVKGLGLMRVAQQSQPQATAGINARVDRQRAWDAKVQGGMNWVGGQIADVALDEYGELNDPAKLKAALDNKYQEVRGFVDMVTQGLTPTQKAAFLTMGVNGLGDITGLAADAEMYITDPESRTWFNATLSGVGVAGGAVSISPSMAAILPIIRKNIDAWHGSPHRFDSFSMSNIGTGEGAQAYGHGLYFAEGKGTGEAYLNNLGGIEISVGDKVYDTVDFKDPRNKMAGRIRSQMPGNNAGWATSGTRPSLDEAVEAVRNSASPEDVKILDEMIADGLEARNTGSLYNVDLKVDPDELLDWDAPFSQQPEKVQKSLLETMKDRGFDDSQIQYFVDGDESGEHFYNSISGIRGMEHGSDSLKSRGILGIRYLDGSSRSAGEGTRNFVIFDYSLVDIKTRNGEALTPLQREAAVGEMMGGGAPKKPSMNLKTATAAMNVGPMTPSSRIAGEQTIDEINTYNQFKNEQDAARKAADPYYYTNLYDKKFPVPFDDIEPMIEQIPNWHEPLRPVDLESMRGQDIMTALGDKTGGGTRILGVNGRPFETPVENLGGHLYTPSYDFEDSIWSSHSNVIKKMEGASRKGIEAGAEGTNTVYIPMAGSGVDYSTQMLDTTWQRILLDPPSKKNTEKFDEAMRKVRPQWAGIADNPTLAIQQLHGLGAMRHNFLELVGKKPFSEMGFPDIGTSRKLVTDPSLLATQKGHGGQVFGRMDVDNPRIENPKVIHPSYDTQMRGQYIGGLYKEIPFETMFPDFIANRRAQGKGPDGDFSSIVRYPATQRVNNEWLDTIQKILELNE